MKQLSLIALFCGALLQASCTKSDEDRCKRVETTAPSGEVATLQAYISSSGISAVGDSRGFFYIIHRQGDDTKRPSICSNVRVSYTGRLTNGTQVDASNNASFTLGNLIPGWQEGIPLIGEGGSITLYLPPSLGYGAQARGNIPANSILVFQIDLLAVL